MDKNLLQTQCLIFVSLNAMPGALNIFISWKGYGEKLNSIIAIWVYFFLFIFRISSSCQFLRSSNEFKVLNIYFFFTF